MTETKITEIKKLAQEIYQMTFNGHFKKAPINEQFEKEETNELLEVIEMTGLVVDNYANSKTRCLRPVTQTLCEKGRDSLLEALQEIKADIVNKSCYKKVPLLRGYASEEAYMPDCPVDCPVIRIV